MYKLINLNYGYSDLIPYLSGEAIFVHYEKHYQNYLKKLNVLLATINYDFNNSIIDLVLNIDEIPLDIRDDVLYNAGGVLNHELYFSIMSPIGNKNPIGEIKIAIVEKYGSFSNFKEEFIKTANKLVGSGYTFLVLNKKNELDIINFSNQDTPYSYGFKPIMTIDLWEHAYYFDYQNRRADYIKNFFEIVSFDVINENYKQALNK